MHEVVRLVKMEKKLEKRLIFLALGNLHFLEFPGREKLAMLV
jgi:hypothetical protein